MAEANDTEATGPRSAIFPAVDRLRWQEKLEQDLKGKTHEDLAWTDVSGLTIQALYDGEHSSDEVSVPGQGASWQVCVGIEQSEPLAAQEAALDAARGGAEAVSVTIASSAEQHGVFFETGAKLGAFCATLGEAGLDVHLDTKLGALRLHEGFIGAASLGIDPCQVASQGASQADVDALMQLGFECFVGANNQGVPFTVNSSPYHGAGASHGLELALSLASGVHVLRQAHTRDIVVESVAQILSLDIAVGTDFFSSIAKLRAARLGWLRVGEVLGIDGTVMIHAVPSLLHQTSRGRWVNTLRNTAYCFGGAVGGADRITLPSHDFLQSREGALGDRIARNTQLVLRLESGLDQVKDAAAGSYYLETRTDETVQRAWELFQEVEGQGGILSALASGWVAEQIRADRARRLADTESGETPILGVSLYPSPDEDVAPPQAGGALSDRTIDPRPLSWDVTGEEA